MSNDQREFNYSWTGSERISPQIAKITEALIAMREAAAAANRELGNMPSVRGGAGGARGTGAGGGAAGGGPDVVAERQRVAADRRAELQKQRIDAQATRSDADRSARQAKADADRAVRLRQIDQQHADREARINAQKVENDRRADERATIRAQNDERRTQRQIQVQERAAQREQDAETRRTRTRERAVARETRAQQLADITVGERQSVAGRGIGGRLGNFARGLPQQLGNFGFGIAEYFALQAVMDTLNTHLLEFYQNSVKQATNLYITQRAYNNLFGAGAGAVQRQASFRLANQLSTPIDTLTGSTQRLYTAGADIGRVRTLQRAIAAVSRGTGATGEEQQGAFAAFAQIYEKGQLSQEELTRQLGNRNIPAQTLAAQQMGISVGKLREQITAGTVDVNQFIDAFNTAALAKFGSMLDKTNDSLDDVNQKLANARQLLDAAYGERAMNQRKGGLEDLNDILSAPESVRANQIVGPNRPFWEQLGEGFERFTQQQRNQQAYLRLHETGQIAEGMTYADWVKSVREEQEQLDKATSGVTSATDQQTIALRRQAGELQKQLDMLQKGNTLMEQRANLQAAESRYSKMAALAIDVASSQGFNAYLGLEDARNAVNSAGTQYGTTLLQSRLKDVNDAISGREGNTNSGTIGFPGITPLSATSPSWYNATGVDTRRGTINNINRISSQLWPFNMFGGSRDSGGPAKPFTSYLIGGAPEILTMGSQGGHVTPMGGSGGGISIMCDNCGASRVLDIVTSEQGLRAISQGQGRRALRR